MKKTLLFISAILLLHLVLDAQSDNNQNKLELEITEDGKRLEATVLCLDAIEAPTKYNEFAKRFINLPGFPKKTEFQSTEELKGAIDTWFKKNVSVIDKVRIERKKAHDQIYGKRPF
ncbi:MAG: hypothetical protein P1U41_00580 [Vicingaceae bacterium]|nr:hypothetical protein [Vicingaceae bacterium]